MVAREEPAPLLRDQVHLAERTVAVVGRPWKFVDREAIEVDPMQVGDDVHEMLHDRSLLLGRRVLQVRTTRYALEQRAGERIAAREHGRHRNCRASQGLDDAGLACQRPWIAGLGYALEPQEPLGDVAARSLDVDDPGFTSGDRPLQSRDFTAANVSEPFGTPAGRSCVSIDIDSCAHERWRAVRRRRSGLRRHDFAIQVPRCVTQYRQDGRESEQEQAGADGKQCHDDESPEQHHGEIGGDGSDRRADRSDGCRWPVEQQRKSKDGDCERREGEQGSDAHTVHDQRPAMARRSDLGNEGRE